jgi:hypothetical protein
MPLLTIPDYHINTQRRKMCEEWNEFWAEKPHTAKELAEALDVIQVMLTYLTHEYKEDELEEGIKNHYDKLKFRGHIINNTLDIAVTSKIGTSANENSNNK